ncbi:MAG: regulatory iron-sulfur-containing complex subunit RicT [Patescibacteria group bacterium]|nr:regulatory iron-sulfur-containing complex subunit RicT [Patescibacteria group bacterium]
MSKVVGIKFPYTLKIEDYRAGKHNLKIRDFVVVEGQQGLEIGQVVYIDKEVKDDEELETIKRKATDEDQEKHNKLEEKAKEMFPIFTEKIEKYGLKMRPIGVSYSLDSSKAIFYFTADGRVDFRELARDLSRHLGKQAILRQIGPRDEAKMIGGYGRCGLPVCCATFMVGSGSISMEDAEDAYGMPKSAAKISGLCGRLMCCIKFEEGKKDKK